MKKSRAEDANFLEQADRDPHQVVLLCWQVTPVGWMMAHGRGELVQLVTGSSSVNFWFPSWPHRGLALHGHRWRQLYSTVLAVSFWVSQHYGVVPNRRALSSWRKVLQTGWEGEKLVPIHTLCKRAVSVFYNWYCWWRIRGAAGNRATKDVKFNERLKK